MISSWKLSHYTKNNIGVRGSKGARYMLERSCLLKYRTNIVVLYLIEPLSVSDCGQE